MLSWSYRLHIDGVVRFIYSSFILKLSITFSNAGDWLVSSFEWTQLCLTRKRKVKNNMEKCFLLLPTSHRGKKKWKRAHIERVFIWVCFTFTFNTANCGSDAWMFCFWDSIGKVLSWVDQNKKSLVTLLQKKKKTKFWYVPDDNFDKY